ncbi:hypothetical protein VE02_06266 [Pseudogymnoascus sp. 03VT05]|nr:hypothetical protein VE02_06266 [Pseudogymnoascus sp. 03VT05]
MAPAVPPRFSSALPAADREAISTLNAFYEARERRAIAKNDFKEAVGNTEVELAAAERLVLNYTVEGALENGEIVFIPDKPAPCKAVLTCHHVRRHAEGSPMVELPFGYSPVIRVHGLYWATPGPYFRKTMLVALARKVSDTFLPEAFYGTSTFTNADGCPGRGAEAEEDLAMGLSIRVRDAFDEARDSRKADEETGGESDEDGDEA